MKKVYNQNKETDPENFPSEMKEEDWVELEISYRF
jgi:hypothetical protein